MAHLMDFTWRLSIGMEYLSSVVLVGPHCCDVRCSVRYMALNSVASSSCGCFHQLCCNHFSGLHSILEGWEILVPSQMLGIKSSPFFYDKAQSEKQIILDFFFTVIPTEMFTSQLAFSCQDWWNIVFVFRCGACFSFVGVFLVWFYFFLWGRF